MQLWLKCFTKQYIYHIINNANINKLLDLKKNVFF